MIGIPEITIKFIGLGATAVQRGSKGTAVLIVKDNTNKGQLIHEYRSIVDFNKEEREKFSEDNVQNILDALEEAPKRLIVARLETTEVSKEDGKPSKSKDLAGLLKLIDGQTDMNCWIAIADADEKETSELCSFIKSSNKDKKKRYKALVYKGVTTDHQHITNYTNEKVIFAGERGEQDGIKAIPYLLGLVAGYTLDMSLIAKPLQKFKYVEEPEDVDEAIENGEFILQNDEGDVRVARAVNSLVTTGQGITEDMRFILITEVMDLMYTDFYRTWKNDYKGKYKNILDNQMLLIGAFNAYMKELGKEFLLDPNFDNKAEIDLEKQRLANIPKYGEEEVNSWDDYKVLEMTVGTHVYPMANVKIPNAMEDIEFPIYM